MSTPDPVQAPAAVPWYNSQVLRSLLIAVVPQALLRLKTQFGIDLTTDGVDANMAVNVMMDAISAVAVYWAARARITKPMPTITLTKSQAEAINAVAPPTSPPAKVPPTLKPPEDTQ